MREGFNYRNDWNRPLNSWNSLHKQPLSLKKWSRDNFSLSPYSSTSEKPYSQEQSTNHSFLTRNLNRNFSQHKNLSLSTEKENRNHRISSIPGESLPSTPKLENSFFTASLVSFTVLNAADYFSTREALKYSGVEEANPLMKPFAKNDMAFAALKLGMTASNVYLLQKLHEKNKTLAWVISGLCNAALSYVVVHNLKVIQKVRQ